MTAQFGIRFKWVVLKLAIVSLVSLGGPARAGLTLTAAGINEGFSLSTFATGFPNDGTLGPTGIAFPTSGGVLVSDGPGNVRRFATDTDGQNAASATVVQSLGEGRAFDMAKSGGNIYMTQRDAGAVVQLNDNGTLNQVIATGLGTPHGIVTDPLNGHLLISSFTGNQVFDVDPVAKTKTLLFNASLDGVTISPDGSTLYGAVAPQGVDQVLGFDLRPGHVGNIVFNSGTVPGDPDGTAIGFGPLSGKIYANTNSGTVVEINLTTLAQVVIATGGSRGDFVTVDPTNGSLLLTQSDSIVRLSNNGNFAAVPEPSSLLLCGIGAVGVLLYGRHRKAAP